MVVWTKKKTCRKKWHPTSFTHSVWMRQCVLSQSCLVLVHAVIPPTHPPTFSHLHITAHWQLSICSTQTHKWKWCLTRAFFFTQSSKTVWIYLLTWPLSDGQSTPSTLYFCLNKQELVPACCVIHFLNEQSANRGDVKRGQKTKLWYI